MNSKPDMSAIMLKIAVSYLEEQLLEARLAQGEAWHLAGELIRQLQHQSRYSVPAYIYGTPRSTR